MSSAVVVDEKMVAISLDISQHDLILCQKHLSLEKASKRLVFVLAIQTFLRTTLKAFHLWQMK